MDGVYTEEMPGAFPVRTIFDDDSPTTLISLFLHERVKIQQGITDIAFTIQGFMLANL